MTYLVFAVACNSVFAIAALSIAYQYGADECMVKYHGISFNYGTWLLIYGWTQIIEALILLTLGAIFCILKFMLINDNATFIVATIVVIIGSLFQIAWYVVGAILFFMEVDPTCSVASPLHKFGLTLFIIKSAFIACGLCNGKA